MAKLVRYFQNNIVTLGILKFNNNHKPIYTLELPWKDNKTNISCIPTGKYNCVPYSSEKYQGVFQIQDVPNRDAILIHIGNYPKDTHGCILPGLDVLPTQPMVNESANALILIKQITDYKPFVLEIDNL